MWISLNVVCTIQLFSEIWPFCTTIYLATVLYLKTSKFSVYGKKLVSNLYNPPTTLHVSVSILQWPAGYWFTVAIVACVLRRRSFVRLVVVTELACFKWFWELCRRYHSYWQGLPCGKSRMGEARLRSNPLAHQGVGGLLWAGNTSSKICEGWNFDSGNYLFTTDTK